VLEGARHRRAHGDDPRALPARPIVRHGEPLGYLVRLGVDPVFLHAFHADRPERPPADVQREGLNLDPSGPDRVEERGVK